MSDCCSSNNENLKTPKQHTCPKDNTKGRAVSYKTILHHVKEPWALKSKEQSFYFCNSPDCDVVYFGFNNSMIKKDQLRTRVGIKETAKDALVCYCFGVTKSEAQKNEQVKAFVIEQTKHSLCSCATYNPSGKCCLRDFPR